MTNTANKRPSEWLRLLAKDWATENEDLVNQTDQKFIDYKPYLKGKLSSQLLFRLSIPPHHQTSADNNNTTAATTTLDDRQPVVDFWGILGIQDEFDKTHIVAQIERFYSLDQVRPSYILDNPASAADAASTNVDSFLFDAAARCMNSEVQQRRAQSVTTQHYAAKRAAGLVTSNRSTAAYHFMQRPITWYPLPPKEKRQRQVCQHCGSQKCRRPWNRKKQCHK